MEFPFDLAACVGAPSDHSGPCVGCIDERVLRGRGGSSLSRVLEELGQRSASAQGLRRPVTYGTAHELGDQRVYLLVHGTKALGILKVGKKRLFVAAKTTSAFAGVKDAFREIEPLCTLDFYVHERCQRTGHGRRLFDAMLAREGVEPAKLAYDRPSDRFLAFLKKHYGLSRYVPQSNNFVVYDDYFEPSSSASAVPDRRSHERRLGDVDDKRCTDRRAPADSDERRSGDRSSTRQSQIPSGGDNCRPDRCRIDERRRDDVADRREEQQASRSAADRTYTATDGQPASSAAAGAAGRASHALNCGNQRSLRPDAGPPDLFDRGQGGYAGGPPMPRRAAAPAFS